MRFVRLKEARKGVGRYVAYGITFKRADEACGGKPTAYFVGDDQAKYLLSTGQFEECKATDCGPDVQAQFLAAVPGAKITPPKAPAQKPVEPPKAKEKPAPVMADEPSLDDLPPSPDDEGAEAEVPSKTALSRMNRGALTAFAKERGWTDIIDAAETRSALLGGILGRLGL